MKVLIIAVLALAVIGIVAAVAVRAVARRIEAWAEAMILSFGLPPIENELPGDAPPRRKDRAAPGGPDANSHRDRRGELIGTCS